MTVSEMNLVRLYDTECGQRKEECKVFQSLIPDCILSAHSNYSRDFSIGAADCHVLITAIRIKGWWVKEMVGMVGDGGME